MLFEWLAFLATTLMFSGSALLTYDALKARKTRDVREGAELTHAHLGNEATLLKDHRRRSLVDVHDFERWLRRGEHARVWLGFGLTSFGFLLQGVVNAHDLDWF